MEQVYCRLVQYLNEGGTPNGLSLTGVAPERVLLEGGTLFWVSAGARSRRATRPICVSKRMSAFPADSWYILTA